MKRLLSGVENLFDVLEHFWENERTQRHVATLLIISFMVSLLVIELRRRDLLAGPLFELIPTNHFYAVDFTFKLLLIVELAGLIFGLAHSVANSVGKQIEIFSLILLRETFKEFTAFDEPITWMQAEPAIVSIVAEASGALIVFVILGFYYRRQRHRPITEIEADLARFIRAKKIVALILLVVFISVGLLSMQAFFMGDSIPFFDAIYTVLIFVDVLLVLISLRYSTTYHVVFRNSGFAVATVLIRLALIAPPPVNALLGIASALFALGLTEAYNTFAPVLRQESRETVAEAQDELMQEAPAAEAPATAAKNQPVPVGRN